MSTEQVEFGPILRLTADAVGPPGRRAFRIIAVSSRSSAWLWVEREQLQALAMLVEQLLTGLPALDVRAAQARQEAQQGAPDSPPVEPPGLEFKVGQMAIGFDEARKAYMLLAHEVEADANLPARFTCQATRQQLRGLAESIMPLLSAGRPRCPMCETPLGSAKHVCPRANGHAARAAEQ